jgi:tRNA nucleotidyltransferase (CCA-adding enzyme)
MSPSAQGAALVLERLPGVPGGPQLLAVARDRDGVFVVGGAVRDLLLGGVPRELDVVVEGDIADVATALAALLPGRVTVHDRFGTASLEAADARLDLATARTERYAQPGALPDVSPSTLAEDLARRDFTVNAMAVALRGEPVLHAAEHAEEDLAARRLRVLHDHSFVDDPTRLVRLVRYAARLGFAVEDGTEALAREALSSGAMRAVSDARIGAELRLLLAEADVVAALGAAVAMGLLAAVNPGLDWDEQRVRLVLELLPPDARADLAVLAACATGIPHQELAEWLDRLEYGARERDVVVPAATRAADLATALTAAERPSEIATAARTAPPEAIALAGALGPSAAAESWLGELRNVRLEIDGDDLLAAGVAAGPAIGRGLEAALAAKLDGELASGRAAELEAALHAAAAE